jgi:hypothetical protein
MFKVKYLFLSFLLWPLVSMSADKHVHGEAELFIAIEGNQVLLELQSPADNIIGFEHAPVTQSQHEQLKTSFTKLKDYTFIASFIGGVCQQVSSEVESPFKDNHDSVEKEHGHNHGAADKEQKHEHNHDADNHSDFYVSYTLECDSAVDNISAIEIHAFKHFIGIKNIIVKWVTPKGQGSAKANTKNQVIALN